jgi:hypothetical protein
MIAFWILLIFSVLNLTLAVPVPVGEILEVRSNAVDVFKDGMITALEKRTGIDPGDHLSTTEAYRKDDSPGGDSDSGKAPGDDAPGSPNNLGSESSWDSEEMDSDARGPDPYYHLGDELDVTDFTPEEVDAALAYYYGHGAKFGDSNDGAESDYYSDGAKPDDSTDGAKSDDHPDDGSGNLNGDTVQSGQASGEGPKSEHPATPEYTTDLEKVLKGSFRPRHSGSGAVGTNR